MSNCRIGGLNVFLYVAEHGCKWGVCLRGSGSGRLCTLRVRRWCRKGVLDGIPQALHDKEIIRVSMEVVSLDSTIVKVHPDDTGALRSSSPQSIGKSRGAGPRRST